MQCGRCDAAEGGGEGGGGEGGGKGGGKGGVGAGVCEGSGGQRDDQMRGPCRLEDSDGFELGTLVVSRQALATGAPGGEGGGGLRRRAARGPDTAPNQAGPSTELIPAQSA